MSKVIEAESEFKVKVVGSSRGQVKEAVTLNAAESKLKLENKSDE